MKKLFIICVTALMVILGLCGIYYFGPGGDGVIGNIETNNGSKFKVVQRYNGHVGEPYSIDFYMKLQGGEWGWCYIDHEDVRWRKADLVYDESVQSVKVYNGKELRAEYFLDKQTFALYSEYERELNAPQSTREPPY